MFRAVFLGLLLFSLIPPLAFAQEGKVKRVLTAKTLELEDGTMLRLAAIQAPNRARDAHERDEPLAQEAFSLLQKLAEGKMVQLKSLAKTPDRKGRIVAEVKVAGRSIQEELLRAGMAWTYTFPDTRKQAADFYAAEAEAEKAGRGVWAEPAYRVLDAAQAEGHEGQFRLVEGIPNALAIKKGKRSYINFGDDWKKDFTLVIEPANLRRFKPEWLESLVGKRIRVRGWMFTSGGPAIELTHPEQVEFR